MANIKTRLSLIRSFIARNPKNREWLTQQYEPYSEELRRQKLNNISQQKNNATSLHVFLRKTF